MTRPDPSRAPADPAELEVLRCCMERTGDPGLGLDDDLWEAGLESLEAVVLCDMLAEAGWGTLEPGDLVEARTPARIRALLGRPTPPSSTVVTYHHDGRYEPLFCVPPGGGTGLTFLRLAAAFGSDRPLHVVEPRGMHRPGPVDRTIDAMADHVLTEVDGRLAPGQRGCLLAYSSGVPVAYEVAGRLRATGRDVVLVMLDAGPVCPLPGFRAGPPPADTPPPAGAVARVRDRWERRRTNRRARRLIADPGPPSLDPLRYRVLLDLTIEAWALHRPRPVDVPTLWVRAANNLGPPPDPTLVPRIETLTAGTDHEALLLEPAAGEIAAAVVHFLAATRT